MRLSEHKDLKQAITGLPQKEKDKLLLRLVAKDKVLTEHLHFRLLEDGSDLELRKFRIIEHIEATALELREMNAKEALVKMRKLFTLVNHFYKVTKDAFGEVELRIYILNQVPVDYSRKIYGYKDYPMLLAVFYLRMTALTLNKLKKLHEDLQFDLTESFKQVLHGIFNSNYAREAESMGLPKEL